MSTLRNNSGNSNINSNNNGDSSTTLTAAQLQDAALAQAVSYVREFSAHATAYKQHKSEESRIHLQRSIALLSTKVPSHCYAPESGSAKLELAKFFVELHAVMSALDGDCETLWSCVTLLQHCSRNQTTRLAIVQQYCFVPLLSYMLVKTKRPERKQRLLLLLQELTYGIHISWEEPYLVVLLEQLLALLHSMEEQDANDSDLGNSHAQLALSILVNLCYKNFVVLFLFLRSVNISSFSHSIQHYGLVAYKMLIILSEDVHALEQRELHTFLRTGFAGIEDCLKQWHVPQLRHITDFLMDAPSSHGGLQRAMLSYAHYCEDVERLLNQIEQRLHMDDSTEDTRKQQQCCLALIFRLIGHILDLSLDNNVISLDAITPRLYEICCEWLEADHCGVEAIDLLSALLRLGKRGVVSQLIAREPSSVLKLLQSAERSDTRAAQVTAILRLLLALLRESKTEKLVLSKVSESFFDKILTAPLSLVPQQLSAHTLAQPEVDKAIYCLLLLISFASIAKKAYFEKCCALLELPQLQYALARAMLSGNEQLVAAALQIAQFEHFPKAAVAKFVASISSSSERKAPAPDSAQSLQYGNLSSILRSHRTYSDKELGQRVSSLIDSISQTLQRNELHSAPLSQLIELYSHRIESLNCAMHGLQQRLEQASAQLCSSTQLNNVQNAELERFQTNNFELLISQERLQTQCKDLKAQADQLKANLKDLLKRWSETTEQLQANERRLAVRQSELAGLQQECEQLRSQLSAKCEELLKLETISKESSTRIDKLKKTIVAYEQDIKEKLRTIEERTAEFTKTHKALEEQREARKKSEDLVSVLETQLQEKKDQIEHLEAELKETEDMRKTIMSLMESKKPKRKA
ncbi:CG12702 [Drosophila busckii]|uniref:CG12702 n=1 Tax=Drosophila busckii TaxID=30019 RepID=A0A0M3QZD1_DROBS|nr:CG12702 [Drosophila busckii]